MESTSSSCPIFEAPLSTNSQAYKTSSHPKCSPCIPSNPYLRFRTMLNRLRIPDKLDSIPLSALTSEEKSQLKEIFERALRVVGNSKAE